jgi:hypothetical protein
MRQIPTNKELLKWRRTLACVWKPRRRAEFELLISGSKVRALVRPPSNELKTKVKSAYCIFETYVVGFCGPNADPPGTESVLLFYREV